MGWGRLDDGYYDHRKTLRLSLDAIAVDLMAIGWANKHETDGLIPREAAVQIARGPRDDLFSELVREHRWTTHDTGFRIHGFLEWNQSAKQRKRKRDQAVKRMRALRKSSGEVRANKSERSSTVRTTDADAEEMQMQMQNRTEEPLSVVSPPNGARPKPKPVRLKVELPEDFPLTDERRKFAEAGGLDAVMEFGKFKAHARRDGVTHKNWDAAWHYWCRQAYDFKQARGMR